MFGEVLLESDGREGSIAALAGSLMMTCRKNKFSERGFALIDFVFLVGALALCLVLLAPRGATVDETSASETIGAEGEAARP